MAFDRTNSGTMGRNQRKTQDTHPDFSGSANIDGVELWISGWVKEGPTGKFFSLSFKPKEAQAAKAAPKKDASSGGFTDDDLDVPFAPAYARKAWSIG